jgi:hypothetical protein
VPARGRVKKATACASAVGRDMVLRMASVEDICEGARVIGTVDRRARCECMDTDVRGSGRVEMANVRKMLICKYLEHFETYVKQSWSYNLMRQEKKMRGGKARLEGR